MIINDTHKATKTVRDYTVEDVVDYIKKNSPETIKQARYELGLSITSTAAAALIKDAAAKADYTFPGNHGGCPVIPADFGGTVSVPLRGADIVIRFFNKKSVRGTVESYGLGIDDKGSSAIRKMIFKAIIEGYSVDHEFCSGNAGPRSDNECYDALEVARDFAKAAELLKLDIKSSHVKKRFVKLCKRRRDLNGLA